MAGAGAGAVDNSFTVNGYIVVNNPPSNVDVQKALEEHPKRRHAKVNVAAAAAGGISTDAARRPGPATSR